MTDKIRIVHVINSFQFGGAEAMLCNFLLRTDRDRFEPSVVSLIDDMTLADTVHKAKIPLTVIGMKPGIPDPRGLFRLARHLRGVRPVIVQTWMDHSNLIGGLAARLATRAHVVWGIHHSNHVPGVAKRSTRLTVAACAKLSRIIPSRIVLCSECSRAVYSQYGFSQNKLMVIPNGFDTERFRPDPLARVSVREEIGVAPDTILIGLAARYDPQKDPANFLRAAAILAGKFPDFRFVLYGSGMVASNPELMEQIQALGLGSRCIPIGPRRDVPRVHAAMDISVLSSVSEAFPLVLGEAMLCGVPCVSTNVGDAALIVGETGRVIPARDSLAMADGCADLLGMEACKRRQMGLQARQRICALFDLQMVVRKYEQIYLELAAANAVSSPVLPGDEQETASAPLTGT